MTGVVFVLSGCCASRMVSFMPRVGDTVQIDEWCLGRVSKVRWEDEGDNALWPHVELIPISETTEEPIVETVEEEPDAE